MHPSRHIPGFMARAAAEVPTAPVASKPKRIRKPKARKAKVAVKPAAKAKAFPAPPKAAKALVDQLREKAT